MARLAWLLLLVLLAPHAAAAAERGDRSPDLDAAERALEDLRYEEARPLLERALRSGQNGPEALARLFRLQGEVAATLGDDAGARRAFARWLVLVPAGKLAEGTSPKLSASLEAARGQLAGAALRVDVEVAPHGAAVALVVVSDPLAMIAGARASYRGERGVQGVVEGKGGARVDLPLPTAGRFEVVVAAVDAYGNRLVDRSITVGAEGAEAPTPPAPSERPAPPAAAPDASGAPPRRLDVPPARPSRPLYASPWLWTGASAAVAAVGVAFGLAASSAQDDLDALDATSSQHEYLEARDVEDRLRTRAAVADVAFVAAGACAVVALVLWLRPAPRGEAHLLARGSGLALEWAW